MLVHLPAAPGTTGGGLSPSVAGVIFKDGRKMPWVGFGTISIHLPILTLAMVLLLKNPKIKQKKPTTVIIQTKQR